MRYELRTPNRDEENVVKKTRWRKCGEAAASRDFSSARVRKGVDV